MQRMLRSPGLATPPFCSGRPAASASCSTHGCATTRLPGGAEEAAEGRPDPGVPRPRRPHRRLVACARETARRWSAIFELCDWLGRKGLRTSSPMNKGGTMDVAGLRVTMTDARHSSGYVDNGQMVYMGEPAGFVVAPRGRPRDLLRRRHRAVRRHAADRRDYKPEIAFLPIGDRFTMGPAAAARACELLGVRQVVPMHWGTFPMLTGTPAALRALRADGRRGAGAETGGDRFSEELARDVEPDVPVVVVDPPRATGPSSCRTRLRNSTGRCVRRRASRRRTAVGRHPASSRRAGRTHRRHRRSAGRECARPCR